MPFSRIRTRDCAGTCGRWAQASECRSIDSAHLCSGNAGGKRFGWGFGVVLALWASTWLVVPALLKWQLPPRLSAALGRTVSLGDAGFKPWNLVLTLDDLAVAGPTGASEPLLKLKRLSADLAISSIFRRAPVIEALDIDAPQLHLTRTSPGHYDIDDLLATLAPRLDAPPAEPVRFALYNLQVRDGALAFDDRPVARVHRVEALQIAMPFLSNLPADVEVKVEPRLAFKLNGTAFDTGARATPFAQTNTGELKLAMVDLDLAPYLGYLPASLPVRVAHGTVSADIRVEFAMPKGGPPSVALKGSTGASNLLLIEPAGAPLLGLQRLQLDLRDVQPLVRKLAFEALRIDGSKLHASRDAAGRINLLGLAVAASAAAPHGPPAAASGAPVPAAAPAWQIGVEALELADAKVLWNDASVKPAAAVQLDGVAFAARQIQWPLRRPIPVTLKGALRAQGPAGLALAEFTGEGPVTDHDALLKVGVTDLSLSVLAPYISNAVPQKVDGRLTAQARLDWSGAVDAPRLKVDLDSLTVDALKLSEGEGRSSREVMTLKQLAVGDTHVDLLAHDVELGSVKLLRPSVNLAREADGRLSVLRRMAEHDTLVASTIAKVAIAPKAVSGAGVTSPGPVWKVKLKDVLVEGGQLAFTDELVRRGDDPVRITVSDLRLAVQGIAWPAARTAALAKVQLSARVDRSSAERGKARARGFVQYSGGVGLEPPMATGKLRVERLPMQLFDPYVTQQLQVSLLRAEASFQGNVSVQRLPAGLEMKLAGDVLLGDVNVVTKPQGGQVASANNTEDLLSWQALALKGFRFAMAPTARPRLDIEDLSVTDLDTRLVITEQGKFNLQTAALPAAASAGDGARRERARCDGCGQSADRRAGRRNAHDQRTHRLHRPLHPAQLQRGDDRDERAGRRLQFGQPGDGRG